jgi:hypothetical protein
MFRLLKKRWFRATVAVVLLSILGAMLLYRSGLRRHQITNGSKSA